MFLTGMRVGGLKWEAAKQMGIRSFDMEDILINTLGFLIGYISWKFSKWGNTLSKKILRFCIAC